VPPMSTQATGGQPAGSWTKGVEVVVAMVVPFLNYWRP
jgi:hypothetical protein